MRRRSGAFLAFIAILLILEACAPRVRAFYPESGRAAYGGSVEHIAVD